MDVKKFTEYTLKECALAEDGKASIDFEILSSFKVFNNCTEL